MPIGVSVLDLLPQPVPPGVQTVIPASIRAFLEQFAAVDLTSSTTGSSTTGGATFHHGTLTPIAEVFDLEDAARGWFIRGAGFDRGVRFQLALTRQALAAGQNTEPQPAPTFQLDLFLEQVSIFVPFLKAATLIPGDGATPAHLEPNPGSPDVWIVGNAVLRIVPNGRGSVSTALVDFPDPFAPSPFSVTGAVASMAFSPPHFFVASSAIGMTVRKLTFDASQGYTPIDIMTRNQGPDWTGLAINEALLYLPRNTPLVGNLVLGVRDVLLGDPFGMQGELHVEWGTNSIDATTVEVRQATGNTTGDAFEKIALAAAPGELDRTIVFDADRPLRFFAQVTTADAVVRWSLPDGSAAEGIVTPEFRARAGDTLICVRSETATDGTVVELPEIRHHFTAPDAVAPQIRLSLDGHTYDNVVSVSGSREALGGASLVFSANPTPTDVDQLVWQLGDGPTASQEQGGTFDLPIATRLQESGIADLVLIDGVGHQRRVRIETLADASLLIGDEDGVFDDSQQARAVQAIERTAILDVFHDDGSLSPAAEQATGSGFHVQVPPNALARVTVGVSEPPPALPGRHERVRMVFDETNPSHAGEDLEAVEQLRLDYPSARLVLIGRCDDIGPGDETTAAAYNAGLARDRAESMRATLIGLGVAGDRIVWRSEQDTTWSGVTSGDPDPDETALGVPPDEQGARWYAREQEPTHPPQNSPEESVDLRARRDEYRRVDIYAEGDPAPDRQAPPPDDALSPTLRRLWIPGSDGDSAPPPVAMTPPLIHRVVIRVAWDSPTATTLADYVPTLAEVTVACESERLSDPANMPAELGGTAIEAADNSVEALTVTGRWTYDARSGETLFAASVDSTGDPNGLFRVTGDAVALAAAFGPAVVAAVTPAFPGANAVGIVGMAGASVALQGAVKDGSGNVVCTGLGIELRQRALDTLEGSRQRLLFDYTSSFDVDVDIRGLLHITTSKPVKIRYRDVGIQLDWAKEQWWNVASFIYEGVSPEVEEPGQWEIDGPLGKLLGIVAVRMGTGSTWFEVDLVFNLDLGVVRITSATIRITADGGALSVEIRGLGVALEIPGVLEGSGMLAVHDEGALAARLSVNVIPAGISATGDLELQPVTGSPDYTYVAIGVEVILPVGIPLANTGLGIFGFVGQFVSNGERDLSTATSPDPVQRELEWFDADVPDKYAPRHDQWALGLGVIVGTLPDMAFTFNAEGMLVIAFPDPSVVLGIDAHLLAAPNDASAKRTVTEGSSTSLIGLVVVDPEAVSIGVRGQYTLPGVLEMNIPLSAYFPLTGDPRGSYVHLGSDGVTAANKVGIYTRAGDPVTMKLLPAVLEANCWAYFMVEERQLHYLGNDQKFSFDGFALGFGAGWHIKWKAGPITLDAGASLLVGLGTSPFKLVGRIAVAGELDLKVVSVTARGNIVAEVIDDKGTLLTHLSGEFCGEVDLGFFSLSGCVGIDIGSALQQSIPEPPHPLERVPPADRPPAVELTDRRGNRVATTSHTLAGAPTVWVDTVPVLSFSHVPVLGTYFEANWALAARPSNGSPWSGTSELKYAFLLVQVELVKIVDGEEEALEHKPDAVFWLPTHRNGVSSTDDDAILPSEHEGVAFALMSWVPFPIFRNLTNGGEDLPADPVRTLGEICDTVTIGHDSCAPGVDAEAVAPGVVSIRSRIRRHDPVAAAFTLTGTTTLGGMSFRELSQSVAPLLLQIVPGRVVDLDTPLTLTDGLQVLRGYELPAIDLPDRRYATLGWRADLQPAVTTARVWLEVCDQGHGVQGSKLCFFTGGVTDVTSRTRWNVRGLRFVKTITPAVGTFLDDVNGRLQIGIGTARVIFPFPVQWAELRVDHRQFAVTVTIKGLKGAVLANKVIARSDNLQSFVIEDLGPFIELVIVNADATLQIASVCIQAGLGDPDTPLQAPPLLGERLDGELALWTVEEVSAYQDSTGRTCRQLMYTAPTDAGWRAIGIPAMLSATLRLIGMCGTTTTLEQIRIRDQAARDALKNTWSVKAGLTSETRPLLEPDSDYAITVWMNYAGWRPAHSGDQPPATVDDNSWLEWSDATLTRSTYYFRTAAERPRADTALPPVDFLDETTFDPRSLTRYLLGFDPSTADAAPVFLDDSVRVHFEVDHVEQLLDVYGRQLTLKVRRTDPPAGTTSGGGRVPVTASTITRQALDAAKLDAVDRRVAESLAAGSECLPSNVNTGGVTLVVDADLEPRAEYDLLLCAPAKDAPDDETFLIGRSHFRSSRYANVASVLADLGFDAAERSPLIPYDFVVVNGAVMPALDSIASDASLEEALRTLGMDPWPLVDFGRTVAIWRPGGSAGEYLLAGLLLELPEPLDRGARCGVIQAKVGRRTMTPVRTNAAGTSVLLSMPIAEGFALRGNDLRLELELRDSDATLTGSRYFNRLPRMAYQEAL